MLVLAALAALSCLAPVAALIANLVMASKVKRIGEVEVASPARWPRLSIVVPACNEGETIGPALAKLRALDYPELELILVDDRSSDATGSIMDAAAREDPRVKVLHLEQLPEGWLGKVHALHRGTALASGELILYTDADVMLAQDTLRRSASVMEARALDHLCLIPDLESRSLLASAVIAGAMRTIALSQRPWHAEDPARKEAIGSGAFNLVRRAAFERTPGFPWLKLEVADDIGLGHLMKQHGLRAGLYMGTGAVKVDWYPTLWGAVRGLEKNGFAQIARYSLARGVAISLLALFFAIGPYLALFAPFAWARAAGVIGLAGVLGTSVVLARATGFRLDAMLLSSPVGDLLMVFICLRATVLGWRRGGLVWRGTTYPTAALRDGMRVKF